jgi:hypothetical protein
MDSGQRQWAGSGPWTCGQWKWIAGSKQLAIIANCLLDSVQSEGQSDTRLQLHKILILQNLKFLQNFE